MHEFAVILAAFSGTLIGHLYQGFMGGPEERIAHHNGLTKMVELRGGIDTLQREIAHLMNRLVSQESQRVLYVPV